MRSDIYKGWIWAVFIGLDQLGNALAGGHPDVTISARLGYLGDFHKRGWFLLVARMVDWAFYPADGEGHCVASWVREDGEGYLRKVRRGNDVGLVLLTLFVVVLILPLRLVNTIRRWFR